MATEKQIQMVFQVIEEKPGCRRCGIRLRFGDLDCPHCGAEIEEDMREWARRLVDRILCEN